MGGVVHGKDAKFFIVDELPHVDLETACLGDVNIDGSMEVTFADTDALNKLRTNPLNRKARRKEAARVRRMMRK